MLAYSLQNTKCICTEAYGSVPFLDATIKKELITWQVSARALYTSCVTSYNDKPIDLCFTIYVLGALSSAVVTLTAKLFNLNFHPLEVVSRWRDPQLQVSENYSDLTIWRSTLFKYCWLMSHFIFNMFKRRELMTSIGSYVFLIPYSIRNK